MDQDGRLVGQPVVQQTGSQLGHLDFFSFLLFLAAAFTRGG